MGRRRICHITSRGKWLPGYPIAERISETLGSLQVEDRNNKFVPVPTISQGIAVYPDDADEIYRLIDVADKRLYAAKERGRNQIESGASLLSK